MYPLCSILPLDVIHRVRDYASDKREPHPIALLLRHVCYRRYWGVIWALPRSSTVSPLFCKRFWRGTGHDLCHLCGAGEGLSCFEARRWATARTSHLLLRCVPDSLAERTSVAEI